MKKLVLSLVAVLAVAFSANAANYKVDNDAIDNIIESATEVVVLDVAAPAAANLPAVANAEINGTSALILNFFLGWCGVHRHYMGTAPGMWALYLFTAGGIFGIVPLVDFVMLIVAIADKGDISKYINNRKFFMWI